jgi:hypothetical protein
MDARLNFIHQRFLPPLGWRGTATDKRKHRNHKWSVHAPRFFTFVECPQWVEIGRHIIRATARVVKRPSPLQL